MSEQNGPQDEDEVAKQTAINEQMGIPPDAARSAAEDRVATGPRKPSSDAVEMERIDRARSEDEAAECSE